MRKIGRVTAFLTVLLINTIYILNYYFKDGYVSQIEYIGLPIILTLAWWCGKQYDIAKYYSEKDPLTEVYNRRFIEEAVSKLEQKQQSFTIFLLDVNDFKQINDTFGHKAGDLYLQSLTTQLKQCVNKKEDIARWGGDEFLILSLGERTTIELAEKIAHIDENVADLSVNNRKFSVSIGTATYPDEAKTLDALLKIADQKMYQQKTLKHGG